MFLIVKTGHKWLGFVGVVVHTTAHMLVRLYLPHPPGATLDSQDIADDLGVLILYKNLCFIEVQVFFFIAEQLTNNWENMFNRCWQTDSGFIATGCTSLTDKFLVWILEIIISRIVDLIYRTIKASERTNVLGYREVSDCIQVLSSRPAWECPTGNFHSFDLLPRTVRASQVSSGCLEMWNIDWCR